MQTKTKYKNPMRGLAVPQPQVQHVPRISASGNHTHAFLRKWMRKLARRVNEPLIPQHNALPLL